MKIIWTIILSLLFLNVLPAQQVINNILLPDSLGSMPDGAFSCVYNETNNCIYVGGQDFVFVLDGATDQKIARIPVTGSVTTMLWVPGENKIFCAHYDYTRVTVIDGTSNSVVTTIPVGVYPICLVYNATNNKVYCANKHSRDITVIDAATNSVITTLMVVGDEPRDMAWDDIDNKLYCTGGEFFTVYDGDSNFQVQSDWTENSDFSATVINQSIFFVADRANDLLYYGRWSSSTFYGSSLVGDAPAALCENATSDKVYCANSGSDNISVISGTTMNVIATLPAGDEPAGLCWNSGDNKIYCLNSGSDDITIIDGVTDTVITTVQVKSMSFNYSSRPLKPHLVINSLNDKLYFPQESEREVRVFDDSSYDILVDVRLGTSPWALAWNATSNKLYSINYGRNSFYIGGGGSISIIDGINFAPLTTLTAGSQPSGVVWNSTNNTVYCANRGSDNVSVIDGISDQIIDTIAVGGQPNAILWNANGNKIYTANNSDSSVSIIDGATHTLLINVPAGTRPRALTLNSTNNKIYCANYGSQNVTVIDGFSNSVIATIPLQIQPRSILWNATNNKIYTASDNNVSIIDGVMDTVITTVQAGYGDLINLSWNATNNKVYCGGGYDHINIINGENNQIINTIWLGSNVIQDLFWNSLDNRLYCFARDYGAPSYPAYPGKLFVIDGVTDSIITRLSLPGGRLESLGFYTLPGFFAADMQHNRIFLANFWEGSISVIDPTATGIIPGPLTKVPERFFLQQNYPNPFNPSTVISWQLAVGSQVKLTVYNVTGEKIAILVNERQPAGSHSVTFDALNLASGVYLYRLETDQFVETKKMVLMR
jgi:YVTN family beta-propeller protein